MNQITTSVPVSSNRAPRLFILVAIVFLTFILGLYLGYSISVVQLRQEQQSGDSALPQEPSQQVPLPSRLPTLFPSPTVAKDPTATWPSYVLGSVTFQVPNDFVQEMASTSEISTMFRSSLHASQKFFVQPSDSGFGVECSDLIETRVTQMLGGEATIKVYQGISARESGMCSDVDNSSTYWFVATLPRKLLVAMTFDRSEIGFTEANQQFSQILYGFYLSETK
ncbi:hypothetical protein KC921_05080 [Candidatus Woesebacteria bacterium]|nr:hypothetical protein [Candidatus Woesebacteria bacterium]